MVMIWNTINVILYVLWADIFIILYECVIIFCFCVGVFKPVCMWEFLRLISRMCVFVMRNITLTIYPNTANRWWEILAQYALCITPNAFFGSLSVKCSFLSPFLFSSALKSCTVLVSRSVLLQNCSAIRNCEFLNEIKPFCCLSLCFVVSLKEIQAFSKFK